MAYHTNTRRAWQDWRRAADVARSYGYQTGWKYRIRRARHDTPMWMVEKTDKPAIVTSIVITIPIELLERAW